MKGSLGESLEMGGPLATMDCVFIHTNLLDSRGSTGSLFGMNNLSH